MILLELEVVPITIKSTGATGLVQLPLAQAVSRGHREAGSLEASAASSFFPVHYLPCVLLIRAALGLTLGGVTHTEKCRVWNNGPIVRGPRTPLASQQRWSIFITQVVKGICFQATWGVIKMKTD